MNYTLLAARGFGKSHTYKEEIDNMQKEFDQKLEFGKAITEEKIQSLRTLAISMLTPNADDWKVNQKIVELTELIDEIEGLNFLKNRE